MIKILSISSLLISLCFSNTVTIPDSNGSSYWYDSNSSKIEEEFSGYLYISTKLTSEDKISAYKVGLLKNNEVKVHKYGKDILFIKHFDNHTYIIYNQGVNQSKVMKCDKEKNKCAPLIIDNIPKDKFITGFDFNGKYFIFSLRGSFSSEFPEHDEIYFLNGTKLVGLCDGTMPRFIDDNLFTFMDNTGISLYNIKTHVKKSILKIQNKVGISHPMFLSNKYTSFKNAEFIALSLPMSSELLIFENTLNNKDYHYKLKTIVYTPSFWPLFSPKARYVAFQSINKIKDKVYPYSVVYDLNTNKAIHSTHFMGYDTLSFFMYDWLEDTKNQKE